MFYTKKDSQSSTLCTGSFESGSKILSQTESERQKYEPMTAGLQQIAKLRINSTLG
jgi:hypothetical protein